VLRLIIALAAAAALAACGDSDSSSSPSGPASGTILGQPFTPAEVTALVVPSTPCALPVVGTRNVSALAIGFSSFTGLCGFVQATGLCGDVASSLVVTATIANAPPGGAAPAIVPGTYPVALDLLGGRVVSADLTRVNATCASDPAVVPDVQGGTITITTVSPRVTGSLDVTFTDGSRFGGTFDAPLCSATVDFCAAVNDTCASPACCPTATSCP
jgi:hypothetical protein